MSIDAQNKVKTGDMEHVDCILGGQCVDNCSEGVIDYSFGLRKKQTKVKSSKNE